MELYKQINFSCDEIQFLYNDTRLCFACATVSYQSIIIESLYDILRVIIGDQRITNPRDAAGSPIPISL